MIGEVVSSDSDCEFVVSQNFSLSRKREVLYVESHEDKNIGKTSTTQGSSVVLRCVCPPNNL